MENDALWGAILLAYAVLVVVPGTIYTIFLHWRAGTLRKLESTPSVRKIENRGVFLGLGFLVILAAQALGLSPVGGALSAAIYVGGILAFPMLQPRKYLSWPSKSWNFEKRVKTIGLRMMFVSLALLIVLVEAGDAIADWLPYNPGHYTLYDFFEAKWPLVIVSLFGLWGAYLYLRGRSDS